MVIPVLSLPTPLFLILISNFTRVRGPTPLSILKISLSLWIYLTLIYSSIDSTSLSHRGVTCICGKMPWPQIQTRELGRPSTLARYSLVPLGHHSRTLQRQRGMLGNGMQNDAALHLIPWASGFLALLQPRQVVWELWGKWVERWGGGFL